MAAHGVKFVIYSSPAVLAEDTYGLTGLSVIMSVNHVVVDGDMGARNFAGGPRVMGDCVTGRWVTGARVLLLPRQHKHPLPNNP